MSPFPPRPAPTSTLYRHLSAIGFFLLLALLMTWPLALQFRTAVPGNGYDSWQNMWNLWHFKTALLQGHNPFVTSALYYPTGISLYLHTLNPLNFVVSLPVHALFGLIAAYNFVVIFSLTASGYTTYLLGHAVTDSHAAGLVAGTIFATSGYLLAQVLGGHTHMMAAEWLPLAVLGVWQAYRRPTGRTVGLAALLLAVNVLCDWQYFLFAVLFAAWYGLAMAATTRRLRAVLPILLAITIAVLLTLPVALPTAALAARTPTAATEGGPLFRIQNALDVVDLLVPSQLHPLWGRLAEQAQTYKAWQEIQNKTGYLGAVTMVLALLALRTRASRLWWATALLFALLSLGPRLQLAGQVTSIPLPAALLYRLPLVDISRYPMRFVSMTMLALAVLGALGSQEVAGWLAARGNAVRHVRPLAVWALLGAIVLDNATLPMPLMPVYIPPLYAALARDTDRYGIFEAPLTYRTSAAYLLYQTVHTKPIIGGYTSRTQLYPVLDEIPLLQAFARAQPSVDIIAQPPEAIAASVLSYFNIRYLVLHGAGGALRNDVFERVARSAARAAPDVEWERRLARDARVASRLPRVWGHVPNEPRSGVLVYHLVAPERPVPFLGLGAGWSVPRAAGTRMVRHIESAAEVGIYSLQPDQVTVTVVLTSPRRGAIMVGIDGQDERRIGIQAGEQQIVLPLSIAAGRTSLKLRLVETPPIDVIALDVYVTRAHE